MTVSASPGIPGQIPDRGYTKYRTNRALYTPLKARPTHRYMHTSRLSARFHVVLLFLNPSLVLLIWCHLTPCILQVASVIFVPDSGYVLLLSRNHFLLTTKIYPEGNRTSNSCWVPQIIEYILNKTWPPPVFCMSSIRVLMSYSSP
jgi:hypothetical protein